MRDSGLHARKRGPGMEDPGVFVLRDNSSSDATNQPRRIHRKMSRKWCPEWMKGEVGCAIEAILLFLGIGLFMGYFLLHHQHRKVILHIMSNPRAHAGAALHGRAGFRHHYYAGNPRSITVVMPSVVNPKGRSHRLDAIFETWGPNARAVYVVHNSTEFPQASSHAVYSGDSLPDDPYSYPQLLLVPEHIGFDDGLPRLFYVIRSVFRQMNPDFAFFVNDHTFVIPEHLCKYLEHKDPDHDMYDGHALKNGDKDVFNSGAAGYILSRETMRRLVDAWEDQENGDEICGMGKAGGNKWLQGNPGIVTTKCLHDRLGVTATDTRMHRKWHRFHAFPLTRVVTGAVDDWYRKKHENMDKMIDTDASYNTLLAGPDCCAQDTVSFHYVEFKESKALFAVREQLLTNPKLSDHELRHFIQSKWPKEKGEIGAYSRPLPKADDADGWKQFLATFRKISNRHSQREC